jgi:translation initiation factor IF-3
LQILDRRSTYEIPQVRIVGVGGSEIIRTDVALQRAYDTGLDLVLVSDKSVPPVCKILDYKKALYEQKKQKQEQKKTAQTSELKEIQLKLNIADHDLETKTNQIKKFLERGDKVKLSIRLKGREKERSNHVFELIDKVVKLVGCKKTPSGYGSVILERM